MYMKQVSIEEANRALNEQEIKTIFLSEANGYDARRLSIVNRPGRISRPISYEVRLKIRQPDETDRIMLEEFDNLPQAVRYYNSI